LEAVERLRLGRDGRAVVVGVEDARLHVAVVELAFVLCARDLLGEVRRDLERCRAVRDLDLVYVLVFDPRPLAREREELLFGDFRHVLETNPERAYERAILSSRAVDPRPAKRNHRGRERGDPVIKSYYLACL